MVVLFCKSFGAIFISLSRIRSWRRRTTTMESTESSYVSSPEAPRKRSPPPPKSPTASGFRSDLSISVEHFDVFLSLRVLILCCIGFWNFYLILLLDKSERTKLSLFVIILSFFWFKVETLVHAVVTCTMFSNCVWCVRYIRIEIIRFYLAHSFYKWHKNDKLIESLFFIYCCWLYMLNA